MHATIPALPGGIHYILKSGIQLGEADGALLAAGMAVMIKLGFGFLIHPGLSESQAEKARHFFENNFVIKDPNVAGGIRYYQGKILIRTRKPQDDMNVLIKFCPNPEALYIQTLLGRQLNPAAIVTTEALSETEADRIERDPNEVDLVIRFKDTRAILGLAERPNVDVAQLLIENLVQITGNFGHMFKFGAIGMNVQAVMKDFL